MDFLHTKRLCLWSKRKWVLGASLLKYSLKSVLYKFSATTKKRGCKRGNCQICTVCRTKHFHFSPFSYVQLLLNEDLNSYTLHFLNIHDILSKILWIFIVKFCAQFATQIYALFCKFLDVWLNLFGLLSFYEETRPHLVDFHNTPEDFMFSKT